MVLRSGNGFPPPSLYEPEIQRTFHEFAEHYGAVVMPARPRHPRDKAKVEVAVQVVERWILARMRKQTFYSLGEANVRISELLGEINERFVMRTYKATRRALFDRVERGALRPLRAEAFEVGTWKKVRVHFDYHVELDHHFYSVSHLLVGAELWGRVTPGTVEIFRDRERVTAHARSYVPGRHTTRDEHMPEAHRQHASWTPARLVSWAETNVGPIMERARHSRARDAARPARCTTTTKRGGGAISIVVTSKPTSMPASRASGAASTAWFRRACRGPSRG